MLLASVLSAEFLAIFGGVCGLVYSSVAAARFFLLLFAEELESPLFSGESGVEVSLFFSLSTRDAMPRRTAAHDNTASS